LTSMLASVGQFPPIFGTESRLGKRAGLLITAALVLLIANLVNLSAIASVGSACSLIIFLLVGIAAFRRRADTGSSALIVVLGITATAVVLVFFGVQTLRDAPETFAAIVLIAAAAVLLDTLWKHMAGTVLSA
jgi:hypothetical protein